MGLHSFYSLGCLGSVQHRYGENCSVWVTGSVGTGTVLRIANLLVTVTCHCIVTVLLTFVYHCPVTHASHVQ
jgi:hypothetical protein